MWSVVRLMRRSGDVGSASREHSVRSVMAMAVSLGRWNVAAGDTMLRESVATIPMMMLTYARRSARDSTCGAEAVGTVPAVAVIDTVVLWRRLRRTRAAGRRVGTRGISKKDFVAERLIGGVGLGVGAGVTVAFVGAGVTVAFVSARITVAFVGAGAVVSFVGIDVAVAFVGASVAVAFVGARVTVAFVGAGVAVEFVGAGVAVAFVGACALTLRTKADKNTNVVNIFLILILKKIFAFFL